MKGRRLTVGDIGPFIEKHHVSVDWLLGGDLKGRLRMARKEVVAPPQPMPVAVRQVMETLDERERAAVVRVLAVLSTSTT